MAEDPLRERIMDQLRSNPSQPATKATLARALGVPPADRAKLRRILQQLVNQGLITTTKQAGYLIRGAGGAAKNRLVGTIKFHSTGPAFFFPDQSDPANLAAGIDFTLHSRIAVMRRDCLTALDGDRVEIDVQSTSPSRRMSRLTAPPVPAELRGVVTRVLSRRSGRVVGIFRTKPPFQWVETSDQAMDGRVELRGDSTAQPGQMVVADISDWSNPAAPPVGRVIEVLGWPGSPGTDMAAVIHRFGLRTTFPDIVLDQAKSVPESPDSAETARREDWRDKLVITIDPADAKDHDDAFWLESTASGWKLAVHIADVSHYVKPDTPMDQEARERGNSTYLADRVLPMLPVELSNGICSLKPHVDRLTKCVVMEVSHDGKVRRARFCDAIIHSRAKLSYEQAQTILDGGKPPKSSPDGLAAMVLEAWKMAAQLRKQRFLAGALDLEMAEVRIILDSKGRAVGAEPVVHTESHQLIEECMLAANEAVAALLRERVKPSVFRIHEDPDPSRLLDYTQTAKLHGYHPGDLTNRDHIQKLLDAAKGRPEEHLIKLGLLKSLKRAAYHADPLGHYGLAKGDYCHFTSPIRRYADLLVHRAIQPFLLNRPAHPDATPSHATLREISRHLSDTERNSAEAEAESRQIKLFEYLRSLVDANASHDFHGLVTDARPMGLFVEVPDLGLRGVVKREDLPEGRWFFESALLAWCSQRGDRIQVGMRVPLRVVSIDAEKRFVDFRLSGPPVGGGMRAQAPPPARKSKSPAKSSGPKRKRKR